jgi:sulfite reductase (ferredoxin)
VEGGVKTVNQIDLEVFKPDFSEFKEKTRAFYAGEMDKGAYKSFSGYFGSYAQRGGQANMLRLRMPAGVVTRERMKFTADMARKYKVPRIHFTTCQTIQLHDLGPDAAGNIMEAALEAGIVTLGGGGDYPRNVMCSPLSGVEKDEFFDVLPWALAAGEYLLTFIKAEKMPRKLKVGFSNSLANKTHATFRDLGFTARPDGRFDVYSAGGLGNQPKFGVKVAEAVEPEKILFYIKAMWLTFRAYGNYQNRGRARTRYMQDALGGPEAYRKAFLEKLEEVFASGEDLEIHPDCTPVRKNGDGTEISHSRVLSQKQSGLYTVVWHPIGGLADPDMFCAVSDALASMPEAQLRLAPDETAYIVNLTGSEAKKLLELTDDSAKTLFESSVSCIGASTCQQGIRDSQVLLSACVEAVRSARIPDKALPRIHISGCPSSCGTHQIGAIGFRGGAKKVDGVMQPAFSLYVNGNDRQGSEAMGREVGVMLQSAIPDFLVKLGTAVAESGMDFQAWKEARPQGIDEIAADFLA